MARQASVHDQASFLQDLLGRTLDWPVEQGIERVEDIAYGWSQDDLRAQGLDEQLIDGQAWQFQPFGEERTGTFISSPSANPDYSYPRGKRCSSAV